MGQELGQTKPALDPVRKILHIDMDAFYASVEQRDDPTYRGKPLVVGGRPERRGAVAAASYEARRFGIHSAMPSRVAAQRCPHLIFVSPRFEVYQHVSEQIRAIFHDYTDLVEPLSLDEAYLDVTENKRGLPSAMAIAREIRQRIHRETDLTASAGVSINKFLAKTASDQNKPNGIFLIAPEQAEAFVAQLPIEKFHGIGPATAKKMHGLGVHCGADLRTWPEAELIQRFGKIGRHYYRVARGQDHRPVNPHRLRKSIGAEMSFNPDLTQLKAMEAALEPIAARVGDRLQHHQRRGHTLTLKLKYADYRQVTRSLTEAVPWSDRGDILDAALGLLRQHLEPHAKVRLLGITVANLIEPSAPPMPSDSHRRFRQLCLPDIGDGPGIGDDPDIGGENGE